MLFLTRLDKMPVLVVEVDGHAYHANNPAQLKRDKMKDQYFAKVRYSNHKNENNGEW